MKKRENKESKRKSIQNWSSSLSCLKEEEVGVKKNGKGRRRNEN